MDNALIQSIQSLIDKHRAIEKQVKHYDQLLADLIHDLDLNTKVYCVVDFNLLFDYLFPQLTGNMPIHPTLNQLTKAMERALLEVAVVRFFFTTIPNEKILLREYAEEFSSFYSFHRRHAVDPLKVDSDLQNDLGGYLESKYVYYAHWLALVKNTSKLESRKKKIGRHFVNVLDNGVERLKSLVDGTSESKVIPLSTALEGRELSQERSTEFDQLKGSLQDRTPAAAARDVDALNVIKSLNNEFGQVEFIEEKQSTSTHLKDVDVINNTKSSDGEVGEVDSVKEKHPKHPIKRFVFWTKDERLLTSIKDFGLDTTLDPLIDGRDSEVSFCRSMHHLVLLYVCYGQMPNTDGDWSAVLLKELIIKKQGSADYLASMLDAEKWLRDVQSEETTIDSPAGDLQATSKPDLKRLESMIYELQNSREFRFVSTPDFLAFLDLPSNERLQKQIWSGGIRLKFERVIRRLMLGVKSERIVVQNPFRHMEQVVERLDIIIAFCSAPIANRYTGFNYESKCDERHPFKDELLNISVLLAKRKPALIAEALRKLFELRDREKRSWGKDTYYNVLLSKAYRIQGRFAQSLRICQRALFLDATEMREELYFEQGLASKSMRGQFEGKAVDKMSLEAFEEAYKANASDPRYIYELAVALTRPFSEKLAKARKVMASSKILSEKLFYSSIEVQTIVKSNMLPLKRAKDLVGMWCQARPINNHQLETHSKQELALYILNCNATCYFGWLLGLRSLEELAKPDVYLRTEEILKDLQAQAIHAYEVFHKAHAGAVPEVIELSIVETIVQIHLSLCELSALHGTIPLDLMESLDHFLGMFRCAPGFVNCYQEIHEEYDKLRKLYKVYRNVRLA